MEPYLEVTHSTPNADALRKYLGSHFGLGQDTGCHFYMGGINDVFKVSSGKVSGFLKVYRLGWRSEDEVRYELELLAQLFRAGLRVSLPVPSPQGDPILRLPLPEGDRPAVLFRAAAGRPPSWPFHERPDESRRIGEALARIHVAALGFQSAFARASLDEMLLLEAPLEAARPFLRHRPEDLRRLESIVHRLRAQLNRFEERGLSRSMCHGDYHCGNLFIGGDGEIEVFDFDVCGPGWTAFDLARWRADTQEGKEASWTAFLSGYQSVRSLPAVDLDAVPLFVLLRRLDLMRIKASFTAAGQWESWDMDFYFDEAIERLERDTEIIALP
ncbi:MAG: phosphotransferase [Chloroflexi bacterium]|nr:phosphotransferase [Chloroflexota bacterium]